MQQQDIWDSWANNLQGLIHVSKVEKHQKTTPKLERGAGFSYLGKEAISLNAEPRSTRNPKSNIIYPSQHLNTSFSVSPSQVDLSEFAERGKPSVTPRHNKTFSAILGLYEPKEWCSYILYVKLFSKKRSWTVRRLLAPFWLLCSERDQYGQRQACHCHSQKSTCLLS